MFLPALAFAAQAHTFAAVGDHFELDGRPFVVHSGDMHYPRVPEAYWRGRLRMAKAMGLNTVCTYAFWNLHEPKPGVWDFKGNNDIARYVRIAGEEGLKVILRPGPYICSEWDLGGIPAWTLKDRSMPIRSKDPRFMALAQAYFDHLGKEMRPLLVQNGGPIIMTQVENEYGSYGSDHDYMAGIRDALVKAGFTTQLFTSDGPSAGQIRDGSLPGIPETVNFGSGAPAAFAELAKSRPDGPRMIGEYWAGWFDPWGKRHSTSNLATNLKDLEWCLQNGVSFNLYMFHGGTNFGFMAGANGGSNSFEADVTSYDYDAALDESGRPTPKYAAFRDLLAKYSKEPLPQPDEVPAGIAVPPAHLTLSRPLESPSDLGTPGDAPRSFEDLDQSYGLVAYRTSAPEAGKQTLAVGRLMDYATVFVDGKRVGAMDRRLNQRSIDLDIPAAGATIELLVEDISRVNFGGAMPDERKGLEGPVTLGGKPLAGWTFTQYPLAAPPAAGYTPGPKGVPAFYGGTLKVAAPGDTFLDLRPWNKGFVWVNGHNLGRFWNVGPQGTLYLPGAWLKKGANRVVVYDEGPTVADPVVEGLAHPILNTIVKTAVRHRKAGQTVDVSGPRARRLGRVRGGRGGADRLVPGAGPLPRAGGHKRARRGTLRLARRALGD